MGEQRRSLVRLIESERISRARIKLTHSADKSRRWRKKKISVRASRVKIEF